MNKQAATAKEIARILTRTALKLSRGQFQSVAAHALQDASPREVAAVARHLSPDLQDLLPKKWLH